MTVLVVGLEKKLTNTYHCYSGWKEGVSEPTGITLMNVVRTVPTQINFQGKMIEKLRQQR